MKPERIERMLQDYLDGRLSADERSAFEGVLRSDPRLSARVEQYRRIGDALREPAAELSPGFYTCAKAQFEASHRKKHRWFRVLSWESAGLATAVVLVGAIFLPSLFRSELSPLSPPPGAAPIDLVGDARQVLTEQIETAGEAAADAVDETLAEVAPVPAVAEPAGPPAKIEARREKKRSAAEIPVATADVLSPSPAEDERPKGSPTTRASAEVEEGPEPADPPEFAPVPRRQSADAGDRDRATSDAGGHLLAPRPTQPAVEPAEDLAQRPESAAKDDVGLQSAATRIDRERALSSLGYTGSVIEVYHVPPSNLADIDTGPAEAILLPAGFVEPGSVRQVTDPQTVERLLRGASGATEAAATPSETPRLVLIGPWSPPFDCGGVRVGRSSDGYVVLLRPAAGATGPDAGCAVALPDDSLPVAVHLLQDE